MELDEFLRRDMENFLAKYEPEQETDLRYEDISAIRNVDYPKRMERLLKQGRFTEAKRIYSELKARFVEIPVAHQEERRAYYKILLDCYKRIYDYVADKHKTQRILDQIQNQADVFDSSVKPQIQDDANTQPARPTIEEAMKGAPDTSHPQPAPTKQTAPVLDPAVDDISFPVENVTPKQQQKPTFIPSQDNHIVNIPENPDKKEDPHKKERLAEQHKVEKQIEQDFAQQIADDYASHQPAPPPKPAPVIAKPAPKPLPEPITQPAEPLAPPPPGKPLPKPISKPTTPLTHSLKNILRPPAPEPLKSVAPAHDDPEPKRDEHTLVKVNAGHVLRSAAQELIGRAHKAYNAKQYEHAQQLLLEARFESRRAGAENELIGDIQALETMIGQQLLTVPQQSQQEIFSSSYLKGLKAMQVGDWDAAQHYFMARVHEAPNDRAALIRLQQCNEVLHGRSY